MDNYLLLYKMYLIIVSYDYLHLLRYAVNNIHCDEL